MKSKQGDRRFAVYRIFHQPEYWAIVPCPQSGAHVR